MVTTHIEDRTSAASTDVSVSLTREFVREHLSGEPTGHDFWHADRVRRVACRIAEVEGADVRIVELAALLHDIADAKFTGNEEDGPRVASEFLRSIGVDEDAVSHVADIIRKLSFLGAHVADETISLEGMCVRDADRLDAMGALGVARTFAYGGFVGRPIHDPRMLPVLHESVEAYRSNLGTSINHFYEKLLLLESRLMTSTGRVIGRRRHRYMVRFLREFQLEWESLDL